jgi:hypothetical protein
MGCMVRWEAPPMTEETKETWHEHVEALLRDGVRNMEMLLAALECSKYFPDPIPRGETRADPMGTCLVCGRVMFIGNLKVHPYILNRLCCRDSIDCCKSLNGR